LLRSRGRIGRGGRYIIDRAPLRAASAGGGGTIAHVVLGSGRRALAVGGGVAGGLPLGTRRKAPGAGHLGRCAGDVDPRKLVKVYEGSDSEDEELVQPSINAFGAGTTVKFGIRV